MRASKSPGPTPPSGSRTGRGARAWLSASTWPAGRSRCTSWASAAPGMSAIATVLAAMGHRVSGSDLKTSAASSGSAPSASTVAVGHDGRATSGRSTRSPSRPRSRRQPRGRCRPRARHPGPAPGRDPRGDRRDDAARSRSAGTHGKTTTSSMLALVLVEAGLRPVVHHRRRGQRDRHRRGVGRRGDLFVVEADESDGTFLELAAAAVHRHQRRARPPRALRGVRRRRSAPSSGSSRRPPGLAWCAPTTRLAAPARSDVSRRDHLRHRAEAADYRMVDLVDRSRRGRGSRSARASDRAWTVALPVPGLHNARNAAAALAMALELGATRSTRPVRALGRYRGRGPPLRVPRARPAA